jgi:hypothetical protein
MNSVSRAKKDEAKVVSACASPLLPSMNDIKVHHENSLCNVQTKQEHSFNNFLQLNLILLQETGFPGLHGSFTRLPSSESLTLSPRSLPEELLASSCIREMKLNVTLDTSSHVLHALESSAKVLERRCSEVRCTPHLSTFLSTARHVVR